MLPSMNKLCVNITKVCFYNNTKYDSPGAEKIHLMDPINLAEKLPDNCARYILPASYFHTC